MGGKNGIFVFEHALRGLSWHTALAFIHGHTENYGFSGEDIGSFKALPGSFLMALVTYRDEVRALVRTKTELMDLIPGPIAKFISYIKSAKTMGSDNNDDSKVAAAAQKSGFGYYVGMGNNVLSSSKNIYLVRVRPRLPFPKGLV